MENNSRSEDIFTRNLAGYDTHLFIKKFEFGKKKERISANLDYEEHYIFFIIMHWSLYESNVPGLDKMSYIDVSISSTDGLAKATSLPKKK